MSQQDGSVGKGACRKVPDFSPRGGRREPTPPHGSLTSTCMPWHVGLHTIK